MGNSIVQPDFKFENMGIGGLDQEFGAIFRRAFASRIFPPSLVQKLGIQHVRGTKALKWGQGHHSLGRNQSVLT
jgi:hypothetical protein